MSTSALPRLLESELPDIVTPTPVVLPLDIQQLLNDGTAIAIYNGASRCGACKIMERTTFVDEQVKDALESMHFLKIYVDKNVDIAAAYSISAVPTLMVLSAGGKEVYRHIGPLSASATMLVLKQFDGAST